VSPRVERFGPVQQMTSEEINRRISDAARARAAVVELARSAYRFNSALKYALPARSGCVGSPVVLPREGASLLRSGSKTARNVTKGHALSVTFRSHRSLSPRPE
jgi:hypothetical protein